jgi:long-chain fatty acid transport protein
MQKLKILLHCLRHRLSKYLFNLSRFIGKGRVQALPSLRGGLGWGLFFLLPFTVTAGGYQLNTLGQKSFGMGGTFTAIGSDASTVFYNPGAMIFNEKNSVTIGGTFVKIKTNYLSPYNGNVEADNPSLFPYHAYLNYILTDNLALGLSINRPFLSDFRWQDDWEGRYVTQEMKIATTYIQPSVSYKINENFGVGGGFVFGLGSLDYRKAIPVEGNAPYGEEELKITGNGFGFNLGAYFKFSEKGTAGLTYRSSVTFDMKDGDATFTDIPSSFTDVYPATLKFNTYLKCPAVISGGITTQFTDELIVSAQVDYTTWSVFDSLNFVFPGNEGADIRTGRHSKNSICGRVGGQYSFTKEFDLRIGAAYDLASVPQDHLSPDLPESDVVILTAGAGYKFNKTLSADVTIGIQNYFERKGVFTEANMNGSYKSTGTIVGIGLNYEF